MGKRAEPRTPEEPEKGNVWSSIQGQIENVGAKNNYISVEDKERKIFFTHPWSLSGGGAIEVKSILCTNNHLLLSIISESIGFGGILGEDEAFCIPLDRLRAARMPRYHRHFISGKNVRDWSYWVTEEVVFPYDDKIRLIADDELIRWLWPLKT